MNRERLRALALECGATGAELILGDRIVTNPVFRDACASGECRIYGKCHMCPPDVGTPEELMTMVHGYSHALVLQTVTPLDDPFDMETMSKAGLELNKLVRKLRARLRGTEEGRFLVLGAGGCRLCKPCAKVEGLPCRNPREALLSMEACCIDVYNTVKDTALPYNNGKNTVTFFGMVLFD